jgi:hypothetical protein
MAELGICARSVDLSEAAAARFRDGGDHAVAFEGEHSSKSFTQPFPQHEFFVMFGGRQRAREPFQAK